MKKRMRISMAVALALILGRSGCFHFGNVAEAAEQGRMVSEEMGEDTAGETLSSASGSQEDRNETVGADTEQKVFIGIEDSEEQQEVQESLEGTDYSEGSAGDEGKEEAGQTGGDSVESSKEESSINESSAADGSKEGSDLNNSSISGGSEEESSQESGEDKGVGSVSAGDAAGDIEGSLGASGAREPGIDENGVAEDAMGLQMPEEIRVVIDPWEIDGMGQVYSDEYVIRNTGETAVKLNLYGLTCRPREENGVIVRVDKESIHDGDNKAIYMELVFGNGDRVIFWEEESEYTVEVQPGEELLLYFSGEVNENAAQAWAGSDIMVSMSYRWDDGKQEEQARRKGLERKARRERCLLRRYPTKSQKAVLRTKLVKPQTGIWTCFRTERQRKAKVRLPTQILRRGICHQKGML